MWLNLYCKSNPFLIGIKAENKLFKSMAHLYESIAVFGNSLSYNYWNFLCWEKTNYLGLGYKTWLECSHVSLLFTKCWQMLNKDKVMCLGKVFEINLNLKNVILSAWKNFQQL